MTSLPARKEVEAFTLIELTVIILTVIVLVALCIHGLLGFIILRETSRWQTDRCRGLTRIGSTPPLTAKGPAATSSQFLNWSAEE